MASIEYNYEVSAIEPKKKAKPMTTTDRPTPAKERPERIVKLAAGYYAQLDNDGLFTIRKPNGEAFYGGVDEAAIRTVQAFAAAMAPQQATPVRSAKVQEALEEFKDACECSEEHELMLKHFAAITAHIATLEQQSDTSGLREALKEVKRMSLDNAYSKGQCGLVASKALAANPEGGVGNA